MPHLFVPPDTSDNTFLAKNHTTEAHINEPGMDETSTCTGSENCSEVPVKETKDSPCLKARAVLSTNPELVEHTVKT